MALSTPSAWTFRAIMLRAALRSSRGAIDPAHRPPNLRDPALVEKVVDAYKGLTAAPVGTEHGIPKTVWMLWQQGWDKAPDLVKACAESWQRQNPGWEVKLLDQDSLLDYAIGYENVRTTLTRQARANMARTMLLNQHGGVWADATLFCARPLDEWLPYAAGRSGFFVFTDPRPYRRLDNWFIVGAKGNYFIAAMLELFFAYWRRFEKPHRYFWMIYLMEHLSRTDPEARKVWDEMGKLSALGPLTVSRHAFDRDPPESVLRLIDDRLVPMHKLNHRWNADDLTGTVLGRLTGLKSIKGSQS